MPNRQKRIESSRLRPITTACTGDLRCALHFVSLAAWARDAGAVMRTLACLEEKEMDSETAPHPRTMGPLAHAYSGCHQLASCAASPVRRFRRRQKAVRHALLRACKSGPALGPARRGLARFGWGGSSPRVAALWFIVSAVEPARRQRIYILMMPGSVRHNNSIHGRLRARRAVVLKFTAAPRACA